MRKLNFPITTFVLHKERIMDKIDLCFFLVVFVSPYLSRSHGISHNQNNNNNQPSNEIIPQHYDLSFVFNNELLLKNEFEGAINITIRVENETDKIVLHSAVAEISNVTISNSTTILSIVDKKFDADKTTFTITVVENLRPGHMYRISIKYKGKIQTDELIIGEPSTLVQTRGNYSDDGSHYLLRTHYSVHGARYAFPCFDEPHLKATFILTLQYPLVNYNVITNIRESHKILQRDAVVERFAQTPEIPPNFLAFAITNFTALVRDNVRIWARPELVSSRNVALNQAAESVADMIRFTNIDFTSFGFDFINLIAAPGYSADVANENWGLMAFTEGEVLDYGDDTSVVVEEKIRTTVAEEIAHLWFGNLVMPLDSWLDVGFAKYFAYFATNSANSDWELNKQFVIKVQQVALRFDDSKSAAPLSSEKNIVATKKGASIVRMMAHILGDKFKYGVQKYLKDNSFKNTHANDLWDAFNHQSPTNLPENKTIADIMDNWINESGYPLITVNYSNNQITISQKRYCREGRECGDSNWFVPISYTKRGDFNKFNDTKPKYWLMPGENLILNETLGDDEWIIVNNLASGYYRVNYDSGLWMRIIHGLRSNFSEIADLNRAQIIDDIFHLGRCNFVDRQIIPDMMRYLKRETNYFVWWTVDINFRNLQSIIMQPNVIDTFSICFANIHSILSFSTLRNCMTKLIDRFYKSVPIGSANQINHTDRMFLLKQELAHKSACSFGHKDCIATATSLFEAFKNNTNKNRPHPNYQEFVYCTALHHSLNRENDSKFLTAEIKRIQTYAKENLLFSVFTCLNDMEGIESYVKNITLQRNLTSNTLLRRDTRGIHLRYECEGQKFLPDVGGYRTTNGQRVTWDFIKEHYETYKKACPDALEALIRGSALQFYRQVEIDDFKAFFLNKNLPSDLKKAVNDTLSVAQGSVTTFEQNEKDLSNYFYSTDFESDK